MKGIRHEMVFNGISDKGELVKGMAMTYVTYMLAGVLPNVLLGIGVG